MKNQMEENMEHEQETGIYWDDACIEVSGLRKAESESLV